MTTRRKWDMLSGQAKRKCLDEIIGRVNEVDDNEIGLITAEDILDIITQAIGSDIYNQGVEDAKTVIQNKLVDVNIDLDLLGSKS